MSESKKKPEGGNLKPEVKDKGERTKAKGVLKSEVGSPKSEGKDKGEMTKEKGVVKSKENNSAVGTSHPELKEHSAIDIPQSELKETLTTDNSLLATNMEVHHHPDLHHKPKPWKEYLLEYVMIFLAVMTGFFAESYREHLSERSKEYEYMVNLKRDFVADTISLNLWVPSLYTRTLKFDTLISYLETEGPVKNGANMYYLARLSTRNSIYEPRDNTITELKSSGSLRLIHDRDLLNSLMDFERSTGQYTNLLDIEAKEDVLSYPLLGTLFDARVFDKIVIIKKTLLSEKEYAAGSITATMMPLGNPQLISHDKEKINLLIYYLHQRKSSFLGEMRRLIAQKELVKKLIEEINKEYKLQDE